MVGPTLTTKLYIPQPRSELVPRPRLIERLNDGLRQNFGFGRKLTLISAPAGFGKTTLVSSWLRQLAGEQGSGGAGEKSSPLPSRTSAHFAWLSLDEADNDLVHFLTYLIATLRQVEADIGQTALDMLQASGVQPPPFASLLTLLINDLATAEIGVILVLDDYHFIEAKPVHQAMTFLLDHLPPSLHLVITSRADPSTLPLSRLRSRGQLLELRAPDLRFTSEETAAFLQQTLDLNLSAEEVALLEARTEGWITGLQLAALSMRGQGDRSNFIADFTGKDRLVVDYLLEEVFQGQPEHIQNFLLQTSLLSQLTGPLCDAVTGWGVEERGRKIFPLGSSAPGQEVLEWLERANLFLVPLDNERQWYRYHQLFVEFLRGRLHRQQADVLPELHRRAAHWYAQNGLLDEAIDPTLKIWGEATTFLSWLEALPDPVVHTRPRLCLAKAWALFNTGQWTQVEPLLQQVERTLASATDDLITTPRTADEVRELQGETAALRAELALVQENTDQVLALSIQALNYLPPENLRLRSMATQVQGFTYRLQGEVAKASQVLAEAGALSQAAGNLTFAIFALSDLAEVQVMQGQLRQAASTFQHIMNLASEQRAWPFPPTGSAYIGMGNLLREWNELDTATQHLHKGVMTTY